MGNKPDGYSVHLDGLDGAAGTLGQVVTDLSSANVAYAAQVQKMSAASANYRTAEHKATGPLTPEQSR
ncbi:hypothetical protein ACH4E7_25100 [Kitasatospora sp. NPDC018058]|uniref:hypothetical protein n=1 Tax=Kitasatospora sp. NPDC018058 TaxID=3364025 RepID=UPI0037BE815B